MNKSYKSHGDGSFKLDEFGHIGKNIIFEKGVLIFHPENIFIKNNVYVGHYTILKGYYKGKMEIEDNVWIGQYCFFHNAGGIKIGKNVGIGPYVKILTSYHEYSNIEIPILHNEIKFKQVIIKEDSDIGIGSIILPGVTIGRGVQVGAGSIVTKSIPDFDIWAGNPAKFIKNRKK